MTYRGEKALGPAMYRIVEINGKLISNTWNAKTRRNSIANKARQIMKEVPPVKVATLC